jgi:hypothetical protein
MISSTEGIPPIPSRTDVTANHRVANANLLLLLWRGCLIWIRLHRNWLYRCTTMWIGRHKASSEWNPVPFGKYITGTDRRSVRAQTVLSLLRPFNTGYRVKYPFFARFLALCWARGVTIIPTICMGSLQTKLPKCIVGIVITRARHSAKIRAKSLIVSEKNYCNHRAPMQWNGSFWPKFHPIFTFRLDASIRYSTTKHAVQSY